MIHVAAATTLVRRQHMLLIWRVVAAAATSDTIDSAYLQLHPGHLLAYYPFNGDTRDFAPYGNATSVSFRRPCRPLLSPARGKYASWSFVCTSIALVVFEITLTPTLLPLNPSYNNVAVNFGASLGKRHDWHRSILF